MQICLGASSPSLVMMSCSPLPGIGEGEIASQREIYALLGRKGEKSPQICCLSIAFGFK